MKINLLALGHKMPAWVDQTFRLYNERLPKNQQIKLVEIAPVARNKSLTVSQVKSKEAELLKKHIKAGDINVALDETGQAINTKHLAEQISSWQHMGQNINILIGGADGLDHSILTLANVTWSLSRLTFPHQLVRVIVAEQIYRAYSLLNNHPYHRE